MRVRRLIRLALAAVLIVPVCAGVAACLAFDRRPAVARDAEFTPDQIERAKRILASNDPRRLKTGAVRTVAVTAADVDVALNYLAHRYAEGSAEARFEPRRLHVRASVRASALPSNPYLNVDVHLVEGSPLPAIERCRVGQLPLPAWLAVPPGRDRGERRRSRDVAQSGQEGGVRRRGRTPDIPVAR